ncbi:unnamed protein product [Adineta ricciae]|uniref:HECT-type E3 ubiquitin transferase n=2 Tax=Adineta ricciae TaxID=249248 RepID=A0A815DJP2_ADIRI|nr:unnamed protein product [Adineta ricciae]
MKIDRSKLKKYLPEPPADCKLFIDKLKSCDRKELHELLKPITIWHIGKCELYHWIDALDLFDSILEEACIKTGTWMLNCDKPENAELKILVLDILHFTALLIEHSYSRHLYNSIEYLIMLLQSSDVHIVLGVLSLLYVFSKRSNFITRLQHDKKQALIGRLIFLAETWGGRENGFDLARCCSFRNPADFPEHATNLHFAYTVSSEASSTNGPTMQIPRQIDIPNVHLAGPNAAAVMELALAEHTLPEDKQIKLFTHLRLAYSFPSFEQRLLCIQARLQALSILVYSAAIQEASNVLYDGLIEELVEVLNVRDPTLTDIKASALKTLTSIIHLERTTKHPPRLQEIIEATQANSYHGFLPVLVRQCIDKLTDDSNERFPQSLSTALFSFLYHLASYETGGDALVNCGIMQSLVKVVNYYDESQDFIMFVTRAVRVIDLITSLDMTSFQTNNGLQAFINRLEHEITQCRKEQPFTIRIPKRNQGTPTAHLDSHPPLSPGAQSDISGEHPSVTTANTTANSTIHLGKDMDTSEFFEEHQESIPQSPIPGLTCYHQRAALLKSILNYLKKAITEPTMADTTRHIMDGSLPNSLKHIISNAEYYGPSLFHLATDVVTLFIFQEPSQLSSLQDNGLTDVLMHALLKKDVPAARDVLSSLPTIFSSLCLNTRGLENFMEYKPFDKLFRVLLSPEYLPAMRRRRGTDTVYGTASNLGNAVDELMRHQVSLRTEAMKSIITLLEQLVEIGNNPKYCCQKPHSSSSSSTTSKLTDTIRTQHRTVRTTNTTNANTAGNDRNSSDDEYDDDEATNDEAPLANRSAPPQPTTTATTPRGSIITATATTPTAAAAAATTTTSGVSTSPETIANVPIVLNQTLLSENKSEDESVPIAVPLLDYITNVMRFVEGVISNNTTDDHGKEFVKLGGLKPLLDILQMRNLPIDFPSSQACQCVAALCKSTLTLLVKDNKLIEMVITNLDNILNSLTEFYSARTYDGSLLIEELARAVSSSTPIDPIDAINQSSLTPTLHRLSVVHSHISLLISLCKISQTDVRGILISFWGTETGLRVLRNLNKLCLTLIWESSILLSLCSSETNLIDQQFNKNDLLKLFPLINDLTNTISPLHNVSNQLNDLTTNETARTFDVDEIISMDTSDFTKLKLKLSSNIQQRIKTIKPLLCVSSKLGRALGELYNLLVRQCSTSQMRHARRFNQQPTAYTPTASAKYVTSTLTEVLRDGFSFHLPANNNLSESQIEKFRLTFFVCTIGFATPMLFDERRRPYMLMLQQFESSKAQEALFSALEWTLNLINRQSQSTDDQQLSQLNNSYDASPTEFLNSALMLILRLVNVKSILESPYSIAKKSQLEGTHYTPFNPLHYLAATHKSAFHILTNSYSVLWDKPYLLKDHATKIIDSILSIFCHILRGESQIQKKLQDEEQLQQQQQQQQQPQPQQPNAVLASTSSSNDVNQQQPSSIDADLAGSSGLQGNNATPLNEDYIQSITSMGFSREHAIEGLMQTNNNLELAVDYCVSHPPTIVAPQPQSNVPDMDADMACALLLSLGQEVDGAALANPVAALAALSRDNNNIASSETNATSTTESAPSAPATAENTNQQKAAGQIEPLSKESVDRFTDSIRLKILDILPDTVYKMCELVVTTMHRNGIAWRDHFLEIIANDIKTSYLSLIELLDKNSSDENQQPTAVFLNEHQNSVLFSRILLMSLLFEEMPFPCARVVERFSLVNYFCILIHRTTDYLTKLNEKKTPAWLASAFIFVDLYEKVSLASKRRAIINENYRDCTRVWQWFDERTVRWTNYPIAQNKQIDDAYANGEPSCKILIQRRNYLIQFSTMLQTNEETHNKRPIMLTFVKPSTKTNADGSTQAPLVPPKLSSVLSASDTSDDDDDDDDHDDDDHHHEQPGQGVAITSTKSKKVESMDTEQQMDTNVSIIESLADEHALILTSDCVYLIRMPVDPDAIHALLRLILRLTRDYKYARQFAQSGGIQAILSLTQTSAFQGCASLITLIFRHVMEDDSNLRLAMEKAIRQALTGNHGGSIGVQPGCPGSHELNVILRILGPAMTRSPDIFLDVASNVLQLLPPSAGRLPGSISRYTNPFSTEDDHYSHGNLHKGPLILQARPATSQTTATTATASNTTIGNTTSTTEHSSQHRVARPNSTTASHDSAGGLAERLLVDLLDFLLTNDDATPKRLLSKSTVLRILAELIRSYANVAKLVSTKTFTLSDNQSCSALSFILDHLLPGTNNQQIDYDKDIPALCRLFLVAMAACNHCLESQMNLVNEVKMSLNKILVLPECDEKHLRLQALANIINTMIESCPAPNTSAPQQGQHRLSQSIINNMVKIMYKRGLINDLAKMIHSIELSSPKLADTVNAVLKPMETLSRNINLATSLHVPASARPHATRHPAATSTNQTDASTVPSATSTTTTTATSTTASDAASTSTPNQTTTTNPDQAIRATADASQLPEQQTAHNSSLTSSHNENRSSMDNANPNNNNTSLNSASQVLLSISQEELMNATDMEPVAGLPQDVDIFERNIRGAAPSSTDEDECDGDDDDDDDDGESIEDEDDDDDDEAVGTINVEFDVAHPLDDTHEHETTSSSTATSDGQDDEDDAEETDSPDEDIDMDSANGNDRDPQHRYSDDDEDITSEEEGDVRLTGPIAAGEPHDDELDDESDNSDSDETHTGDELDETEGPTIDIHIETASSQSTDEHLAGDNDRNDQTNETCGHANAETANNNDNNQEEEDDDDEDEDEDEEEDDEEQDDDEDDFAGDDDANAADIEEMIANDMDAANAWQDEEEEDEDEDDEDESTEFEDEDGDIADYVHEMEFDEEVLSEIRNNLMSPTDIDPILISNLQGVRIRATGFPSLHGINDTTDPALPPPPMSVPALHPLLVHHADNQLSSGAFSRFRQLGATATTTTTAPNPAVSLNVLPTHGAQAATLTFGQQNGPTATILTGPAAVAAHQQLAHQTQRNRTTRTLFIPGGTTAFGRTAVAAGGFSDYLNQVNQLDVDPLSGSTVNNGNIQGTTTARILVGNGADPDAWRFLHDQILMDIAPQANEGNENIDGTKIYMIRTPLARWMEESVVLDGPYVHDTVLALKSKITEPLEKQYESELQVVLAKKAKDEEERKKRAEEKARQDAERTQAAVAAAAAAAASTTATTETSTTTTDQAQTTATEPVITVPSTGCEIQHVNDIVMTSPEQYRLTQTSSFTDTVQDISSSLARPASEESTTTTLPPTGAVTSPLPTDNMSTGGQSPAQLATSPTTSMEINHPSPPKDASNEQDQQHEEQSTTNAETTLTASTTTEEVPSTTDAIVEQPSVSATATSTTTAPPPEPEVEWTVLVIDGREFRVPKALEIDPSFLAALPEELRQEILTDQVRNFEREESQRRAQRAAAYAAANPTASLNTQSTENATNDNFSMRTNQATTEAVIGEMLGEINPEFISALPQEIREELLAERRRTAAAMAAMSGVNLPDSGPAEFLRTLQPHLREQVLADMDESQIGALPEDIANEARALRAAMETQQQQYLRDRMVRTHHDMMNMLTNNTHHSTRPIRMYNLRALQEARNNRTDRQSTNWYSLRAGANAGDLNSNPSTLGTRGRQLLDYESVCCLLVLLFIDDPRLNLPRLQKVLRYLCHHNQTRQWIIKALLSIINKSTGSTEYEPPTSTPGAPTLVLKNPSTNNQSQSSTSTAVTTSNNNETQQVKIISPSWLTINFESAFGARTNVFRILRLGNTKRHGSVQISVHAQACPIVCRQVLDSLIILAKNFPEQFLPLPNAYTTSTESQPATLSTNEPTNKVNSPDKQLVATPSKASTNTRELSFWELLLKLDQSFSNRTNRSSSNSSQNIASIVISNPNAGNSQRATSTLNINNNNNEIDFESSPLAALLLMLNHPILNKNSQLMDKLFKLLSLISQSFSRHIITKKDATPSPLAASTPMATDPSSQTVNPFQQQQNLPTLPLPVNQSNTTNKLVVSDDQVILGSQLDLVINALILKSCAEDGLECATKLLLDVSKINQATRDKVLHLLLDGIRKLGEKVSREIKQLLLEVQDYLSKNKSLLPTTNDDDSSNAASDESLKLFDSYRSIRSNTLTSINNDPNAKQQDLQLPAMVMLTSKTANQQFLLRILRVIIELRNTTKKEQLDAQTHFETELHALARRLDTLRQSLRSQFPSDAANQQNETLQPIDELANRLEQMRTRLQTVLNSSTLEQRQQIFSQQETINDIQNIYRLIQQLEVLIESFHEPTLPAAMTTRINDVLQTIPPLLPQISEPMDVGALLPATPTKLSDLLNINQLWNSLSDCLSSLARLPDPHAVLVLQPAVEAFFIVHAADLDNESDKQNKKKKDRETREALSHLECFGPAPTTTSADRGAPDEPVIAPSNTAASATDITSPTLVLRTGMSQTISTNELPLDAQKFVEFARTHRTVLNQILRQSTQHLSEGPFHILTDYTAILDFDVKRKYFRYELDRLKDNNRGEDLAVHVRRQNVFEDSYRELSRRQSVDWKHRFYIVFDGEEGQDAGGLLREWYSIIARSMFDSNYALFMINPGDRVTYMPNPSSHINTNHSQYFKFIGRVIAKAIFDNKFMDCYFTRSFYKHILGIPIRYTDMESVDLQFYKNLVMLLENDLQQLGLDLTFSLDVNEFGENKVVELIPNGSTIAVTNENKHEYVRLVCQEKMIGSIRLQINSFLEGFYSIIPKSLISIFNEQELELLISGLPDIDIEDLKANTEYHKYRPNSLQVQWFWRALRSFDKEDLAKFLQFVTGTSKVPLQGFAHLEGMNGAQKFQIHRDDRSTDRLPSAHTCFNQLDLPAYESYDKLRKMLLIAIRECAGFGFA